MFSAWKTNTLSPCASIVELFLWSKYVYICIRLTWGTYQGSWALLMETDSVDLEFSHSFSKALLALLKSSQILELLITTSTIPIISAAVNKECNVSSFPISTLNLPLLKSLMISKQLNLLSKYFRDWYLMPNSYNHGQGSSCYHSSSVLYSKRLSVSLSHITSTQP